MGILKKLALQIVTFLSEIALIAGFVLGAYVAYEAYVSDWLTQGERDNTVKALENDWKKPENPAELLRYDAPPPFEKTPKGKPFGTMIIPKWGNMKLPMAEGVDQWILDKAMVGHYPDTQLPGEVGNFGVAAHRRSRGSNFRRVDVLEKGDPIILEMKDYYLVYKVESKKIVLPTDVQVLNPIPEQEGEPTERLMTMTTCTKPDGGQWGNSHRYIVFSKLDHWVPKSSGHPAELDHSSMPKGGV